MTQQIESFVVSVEGIRNGAIFWLNSTPPKGPAFYITDTAASILLPIALASLTTGKRVIVDYEPGAGPNVPNGLPTYVVVGLKI